MKLQLLLHYEKETRYMGHRYVIKLMQQYNKATGNPETVVYDPGFLQWLGEYKKQLQQLKAYYKSIGIDINNSRVYETDKGKIDTIAYDFSHQITQYEDPYWYLTVFNNKPTLIDEKQKMYDISSSSLIYTFNPYDKSCLDIYPRLTRVNQQVAISMVGNNSDYDKEAKIAYLKELKTKLLTNVVDNYVEDRDMYIYSVNSEKPRQTFGSARMH